MSENTPELWAVLIEYADAEQEWAIDDMTCAEMTTILADYHNQNPFVKLASVHRLVPAEQLDAARAELADLREAVRRVFNGVRVNLHPYDCAYSLGTGDCDCNIDELQAALDRAMEAPHA